MSKRKLKKNVQKVINTMSTCVLLSGFLTPVISANTLIASAEETPIYEMTAGDEQSLEELMLDIIADNYDDDMGGVLELDKSSVTLSTLNSTQIGMQLVQAQVEIATSADSSPKLSTINQEVLINVKENPAPILKLKSDIVTVFHGATFLPESFIGMISMSDGTLPSLTIENNVDTSVDGMYTIKYKATGRNGASTVRVLIVNVKTPQEVLDGQSKQLEYDRAIEAMTNFQYQEAINILSNLSGYSDADAQLANAQTLLSAQLAEAEAKSSGLLVGGENGRKTYGTSSYNPYPFGWANCTYGAWEAVYENTGIKLPAWGDAHNWYGRAAAAGYEVGSEPRVGAIVVYEGGPEGYGHVAYIDEMDEYGNAHIIEGGYDSHYHSQWGVEATLSSLRIIGYIYVS